MLLWTIPALSGTHKYLKHSLRNILIIPTQHTSYTSVPQSPPLHVSQIFRALLRQIKTGSRAPCQGRGQNQVSPKNNRIQCTLNARIAVKMAPLKPIDFLLYFSSQLRLPYLSSLFPLLFQHPVNIPDKESEPWLARGNSDPQHKSDPSPAVDILMERFTRFYKEVTPSCRGHSLQQLWCHCSIQSVTAVANVQRELYSIKYQK